MSRQQRVSVRRTANSGDDLALLQGPGVTASDAVRHAVRLVAQAQRYADQWAQTQDAAQARASRRCESNPAIARTPIPIACSSAAKSGEWGTPLMPASGSATPR